MKLVLFFTKGLSLKNWVDTGLFEREKRLYEAHLQCGSLKEIYWITYGANDEYVAGELYAAGKLDPRIRILTPPFRCDSRIRQYIFMFLAPFIHQKYIKTSNIIKTNQMNGALSAIIAKLLFGVFLYVRTGYTLSIFRERNFASLLNVRLVRILEKLAYKVADLAAVSSEADRTYISKNYRTKKLKILRNPIDVDLFSYNHGRNDDKTLLVVSRLEKQKNLLMLVHALAQSEIKLHIVGDGTLKHELITAANRLNVDLTLLGKMDNTQVARIMSSYSYFVICSHFEGMPKTLLEAMSSGLLCIGTDVPGINEVIDNHKTGLLCKNNMQDLSLRIKEAFEFTDDKFLEITSNARDLINNHYSTSAIQTREKDFFKDYTLG